MRVPLEINFSVSHNTFLPLLMLCCGYLAISKITILNSSLTADIFYVECFPYVAFFCIFYSVKLRRQFFLITFLLLLFAGNFFIGHYLQMLVLSDNGLWLQSHHRIDII